jgi:hypothetical protein
MIYFCHCPFVMWLFEHFCINPLVLILTSNFGIWVILCHVAHNTPHPLWMNYIYYKPNEQYLHLIGLTHFVAMLEHLSNTFIILIMHTHTITLTKKCNLIFLYNYIAHFHERTLWCIKRFVYACISNFWFSFVYGWVLHNAFQIAIPTYQSTHVHVPLP